MEEAVHLWPQSRYAHAGLAHALLVGHGTQASPADKRRAADELLAAAEIAFSEGRVRCVSELAQILADFGDKAALDRYFQRVFQLLPVGDTGPWYGSYLQYAQALARLRDEQAETYFRKAVEVIPEGVGDAYESYARYLLGHHKAQAVMELLVPNSKVERAMYKPVFYHLRCQALEQIGRKAEATEACQRARDLTPSRGGMPSPGGQPGSGPSACGPQTPDEPGFLARLLGVGLAHADYENTNDDCRVNQTPYKCTYHPEDPAGLYGICFYDFVWNLAELITREAGGELFGSRAAVAWTVRDRVNRVSTSACGTFGGATGTCTSQCPDPQFCDLQKKYCCVIRSGQFNFGSTPVSVENLYLAYDVVDSHMPEPTSNFVPSGASGCTTGVCNSSLFCSQYGNDYEYAPEGPIFFYGNSATSFVCRGFQPGIASSCNVVAKETCGNSTDGVGSDNCYGRATRNRTWFAGPQFTGSAGVTTSGNTKRLPSGAFMYRNDTFKNPRGKEFRVEARL
jgi:tetratricopeptide (TPR) repeat protein